MESRFVLDRHDAVRRGLHFDLRIKLPDSDNWLSFSMNEFPPTEVNKRIYIVKTNLHSSEEALFTGTIKSGYGAGKITRVDQGKCKFIKNSNAHIVVEFKGKKLKGIYHFINTSVFSKQKANYYRNVYAFFKGKAEKLKEQYNYNPKETRNLIEKISQFLYECDEKSGLLSERGYNICQLKHRLINDQNLRNKFSNQDDFEEYVGYQYEICWLRNEVNGSKRRLVCAKKSLLKCKDNNICKQFFVKEIRRRETDVKKDLLSLQSLFKYYHDFLVKIKKAKLA